MVTTCTHDEPETALQYGAVLEVAPLVDDCDMPMTSTSTSHRAAVNPGTRPAMFAVVILDVQTHPAVHPSRQPLSQSVGRQNFECNNRRGESRRLNPPYSVKLCAFHILKTDFVRLAAWHIPGHQLNKGKRETRLFSCRISHSLHAFGRTRAVRRTR